MAYYRRTICDICRDVAAEEEITELTFEALVFRDEYHQELSEGHDEVLIFIGTCTNCQPCNEGAPIYDDR